MRLLSSVANRAYWMARYLERTHGTINLINEYTQLVLDIPSGSEPGWETLISTYDSQTEYQARFKNINERNVMKFMIPDRRNPSSVYYSLKCARENARTTRDVLPEEAWHLINEMYLCMNETGERAVARRDRFELLDELMGKCLEIYGLLQNSLNRDHAYSFLKLGFLTERADITSRVVDVAAAAIVARSDASEPFLPLLWTYVLKTLSANNAYRREIGPTVSADDVVNFVFKNERFPRSAAYCFNEIRGEAANLKNNSGVNRILDKFDRLLDKFDAEKLSYMQLHNFINEFQELLFTLNKATSDAWFTPKS